MNWRTIRAKEALEILSGYAFKSTLFNEDGKGTPIIRIRDVGQKEAKTFFDGSFEQKYLINKGSLLVSMDGEFRLAEWKGRPSLLNQRVCKISVKENDLNEGYLKFFLPAALKDIEDKTPFVTVKHLSVKAIESIEIPLPPLPIQKKIAAVLEKADELRRKREEQIKRLDDLLQATFLDMFGDPVTNPKGWPMRKLEKLGQLDRGKSKHRPRNAPELLGGAHPLIQTGDVANSDCYITEYSSTYSDIGLAQSKMWNAGVLCITIAANIAKTAILSINACFPDSVVGFIPSKETNVEFVHTWFSFFQQILEKNAPESAQKNINLAILRELNVIMPPVEMQSKFKDVFEKIQADMKMKQKADLALSTNLFNSLMQRAFKGELDLT